MLYEVITVVAFGNIVFVVGLVLPVVFFPLRPFLAVHHGQDEAGEQAEEVCLPRDGPVEGKDAPDDAAVQENDHERYIV